MPNSTRLRLGTWLRMEEGCCYALAGSVDALTVACWGLVWIERSAAQ